MGETDPPPLFPPEQWERIKRVFDEVAQLPAERHAAAVAAATSDVDVQREVLTLLAIHIEAGDFLDPAAPRALATGHRLGPYEIVAPLGSGGMSDVYRARDTRLARSVAIKVLRDAPTSAAARARFVREARSIAAISHSNVLAVFDVGEDAGVPYLVTEVLEGETLRARLERGVPALADALAWARQIARGLAAAHDRGIIHRDLKPENVMLLHGGELKLLDFGLARPTMLGDDRDLSLPGTILGTPGYLAPEQARGKVAATTADLFALGAIVFELVTGRRAFSGDSIADTLRAVLDDEPPPPSSLRPEAPAWLDRIVARCLAKDPAVRFQSARDLAFVLESAGDAQPAAAAEARRRGAWPIAAGILLATTAALAVALVATRSPPPPPPATPPRAYMLTHSGRDRHPAVSPDGKLLAFASDRDGTWRIWIKQLEAGHDVALTAGPDGAPRFSPDGNEVLFTRDRDRGGKALYRVGVLPGSEPRKIVDDAGDGDWSPDGRRVVFVQARSVDGRAEQRVVIVDIDGSHERAIATLDRDRVNRGRDAEQRVRWSPDGTQIALTGRVRNPGTPQHVLLVPVDGSAPRRLPAPSRDGMVSAVAWQDATTLLYAQAASISGSTTGSAAQIVRQRIDTGAITTLWWSLESGTVLDRWPGRGIVLDVRPTRQNLREYGRAGGSRMLSSGTAIDRQPALTPDGGKVVFSSNRAGGFMDLYALDRRTGAITRLTEHAADDYDPAVTPDGRSLLWTSNRTGVFEVWMADIDGTNPRQITRDASAGENPCATPDGAFVVYAKGGGTKQAGLWRVRSDGTQPTQLVPDAILPEVSPDGAYVLFLSNADPRRPTIGIARVADGTLLPFTIAVEVRGRTPVLLGRARWSPDGSSIAFIGQDQRGSTGVYLQKFDATATDTAATRTALVGFSPDADVESFDLDGDTVIVAEAEHRSGVVAVTNLAPP